MITSHIKDIRERVINTGKVAQLHKEDPNVVVEIYNAMLGDWQTCAPTPVWNSDYTYRVKPEPVLTWWERNDYPVPPFCLRNKLTGNDSVVLRVEDDIMYFYKRHEVHEGYADYEYISKNYDLVNPDRTLTPLTKYK